MFVLDFSIRASFKKYLYMWPIVLVWTYIHMTALPFCLLILCFLKGRLT